MRSYKSLLKSLMAVSTVMPLFAPIALAETQPEIVRAPVDKVFVPLGFDDNDNVEVVLHGHFTSSCYKVGPMSARVDYQARKIYVDAKAYHYRQGACAQMIVPFTETINLGLVKEGTYEIVVNNQLPIIESLLEIKAATSSNPDDYLYAPVDNVKLETTRSGQTQVSVEGTYPHMFIGCMVLRDLKLQKANADVIVVQPIAELVDGPECEAQSFTKKFNVAKAVDFPIEKIDYLLHARATSGRSINRLIETDQ